MEVQFAEWHEKEYPPTMQQRIYRVLCWILGLAFYFSFLFNYPYRLEALTCFGVLLVIIQFFSGSLKPIETAMKNLMRQYTDKNTLPVWITINCGDQERVSDRGAMWTENGWLIFQGLETEFRIPRVEEVQLSQPHWPIGWLVEFNMQNGSVKIDISKTYSKPHVKDLNERLNEMLKMWALSESMPAEAPAILPMYKDPYLSRQSDSKHKRTFYSLYIGGLAVLCLAIWFFPDQIAYRLNRSFIVMVISLGIGHWFSTKTFYDSWNRGDFDKRPNTRKGAKKANL